MSGIVDFQFYCDELLLFAAKNCDGSEHSCVGAHFFFDKYFPAMPDGWRTDVAVKLTANGFGSSRNSGEDQEFFINPSGLIHAREIEKSRLPKRIKDRFLDVPRSDWISIGAFLISLIALFK